MTRSKMRVATVFCASLALSLAGVFVAPTAGADGWRAVKAATARFHSIQQAQTTGYSTEHEPCVEEAPGTMGIHAVNHRSAADQSVDPKRPEILLYVPRNNGQLELVGVEYFMVALVTTANGPAPWFGTDPPSQGFITPLPSVLGQPFNGPMPGHNPSMPWHYDLHVWLWEDNPAGLFAPFNPSLSC